MIDFLYFLTKVDSIILVRIVLLASSLECSNTFLHYDHASGCLTATTPT